MKKLIAKNEVEARRLFEKGATIGMIDDLGGKWRYKIKTTHTSGVYRENSFSLYTWAMLVRGYCVYITEYGTINSMTGFREVNPCY